ncbi:MAG: FtsX-like permease family protein [Luteitalea sp.]|nr:FtsX-like permease family protein [Luteitalea sp.]
MTARINLPEAKYPDELRTSTFYRGLLQSLEGRPEVQAVGLGTSAPFTTGVRATANVRDPASSAVSPDAPTDAVEHMVSPDYFRAVGAPLLAGRFFGEQDRLGGPLVALVSQGFARHAWPDRSPIGQTLERDGRRYTVVGVVGDMRGLSGVGARGGGLDRAPQAAVYFAATQWPRGAMTLLVRVSGEPSLTVPAIREAVSEIDPAQPIYDVRSLDDWLDESAAQPRVTTMLAAAFALTALLLAAVGIYGVLSYTVAQRTHEIGLRLALGAGRTQVLWQILRGGLRAVLAGMVVGTLGAYLVGRAMQGLSFGVGAIDPLAFSIVVGLLLLSAVLACMVPARRAASVDPLTALRDE